MVNEKSFWAIVLIAAVVLLWGVYHVYLAFRKKNTAQEPIDDGLSELDKHIASELKKSAPEETEITGFNPAEEIENKELEPEPTPMVEPKRATSLTNLCSLSGAALWEWWKLHTGNWNMPRPMIDVFVVMLKQEQVNELLGRYKNDHPGLYQGIQTDKNWEKRADVCAKAIGTRIEALMRRK